jgi:hypothetical protein
MLYPQHIFFIKIQLMLSKLSFSIPLQWNNKTRKLEVLSPIKRKAYWFALVVTFGCYVGRILATVRVMYELYATETVSGPIADSYVKHQALCFFIGLPIFCAMQFVTTFKRNEVCSLINSLIDFEIRYTGKAYS